MGTYGAQYAQPTFIAHLFCTLGNDLKGTL